MNILVVEDNASVSAQLASSMERWNHNVETAGTAKDALDKVRQKKFDLVLLDIYLPDSKGHDLIPHFKALWHDIGIVTMTGYNSRELELAVRQQGILYYMLKPFSVKALKEILDHISRKKNEEEIRA